MTYTRLARDEGQEWGRGRECSDLWALPIALLLLIGMRMAEDRIGNYEPQINEDGEWDLDSAYLQAERRQTLLEVRTHVPATVVSFDAAKNEVWCTVDLLRVIQVEERPADAVAVYGEGASMSAAEPALLLKKIPVVWPRTAKGWLTFPLAVGDTGDLHVGDRSLQRWQKEGKPVDPILSVVHDLAFSRFYPGLHHDKNKIPGGIDMTATVLHGDVLLKLDKDATDFVALHPALNTFLAQILATLNSLTGSASFGTPPPSSVPNFAATKVKAK